MPQRMNSENVKGNYDGRSSRPSVFSLQHPQMFKNFDTVDSGFLHVTVSVFIPQLLCSNQAV